MRYTLLLIMALGLASCGITRDYSSANRVTLQFSDSTLHDCYLLSLAPDALVVTDVDPAGLRSEALSSHLMIVPARAVDRVYRRNRQSFVGTFIPTVADIFSERRAFRVNAFGTNLMAVYDASRFAYDYFTSAQWSEYELTKSEDVEMLRSAVEPLSGSTIDVLSQVR